MLGEKDRAYLHEVFDRLILPVVTPLTVDPSDPFPYISNLSLNVGVEVRNRSDETSRFARVKVPPNVDRLLRLPDGDRFIPLEQTLVAFVDELFPGMDVGDPCVLPGHPRRRPGPRRRCRRRPAAGAAGGVAPPPLPSGCPPRDRFADLGSFGRSALTEELGLGPDDVYRFAGPLGLGVSVDDRCPRSTGAPRRTGGTPLIPVGLTSEGYEAVSSIFSVLDRQDVLVHHPYDSFSASVEELMNEAADDPQVLAIKQCLYRTSGDSPVVAALGERPSTASRWRRSSR